VSRHRPGRTPGYVLVVWGLAALGISAMCGISGATGMAEQLGRSIRSVLGW
jgi:hypothetical protein